MRVRTSDPIVESLLARYGDRITARVAETGGMRFDIALEVSGLEIMSLRLRGEPASAPVLLYGEPGKLRALDRDGEFVPLPL